LPRSDKSLRKNTLPEPVAAQGDQKLNANKAAKNIELQRVLEVWFAKRASKDIGQSLGIEKNSQPIKMRKSSCCMLQEERAKK
jgi:hypothetical protein